MSNVSQIIDLKRQAEQSRDAKYMATSKSRLKKNTETKIKTTMIGAISAIEKQFGFLFGYDENGMDKGEELNDEEQFMLEKFKELRANILELGNKQISNACQEIDQYDVTWNRFHISLPITPMKVNNE